MNCISEEEPSIRRRSARIKTDSANTNGTKEKSVSDSSASEGDLENIYLQDNIKLSKFRPSALETIYESPRNQKSPIAKDLMSTVKFKRECRFTPFYNPSKVKLKMRKKKAHNLKRNGVRVPTGIKVTVEQVESVLKSLHDSDNKVNEGEFSCIDSVTSSLPGSDPGSGLLTLGKDFHNLNTSSLSKMDTCAASGENNDEDNFDIRSSLFNSDENFDIDISLHLDRRPNKVDKRQRQRRRSRKLEPISVNVLEGVTPSSDSNTRKVAETRALDQINGSDNMDPQNENFSSSRHQGIPLNVSAVTATDNSAEVSLNITNANQSCSKEPLSGDRRRKPRRNSGVRQSLYKSSHYQSFHESESPESSLNQEQSLSPPSLIQQLNINALSKPSGRRKSARLSVGSKQEILGSLWLEGGNISEQNLRKGIEPSANAPDPNNAQQRHSELDLLENGGQEGVRASSSANNPDSRGLEVKRVLSDGDHDESSPVISGIFAMKARLTEDRKIVKVRGSRIDLSHFNLNLS